MDDPWDELARPYIQRVLKALKAASIDFPKKQILPPDSTSDDAAVRSLLQLDDDKKSTDLVLSQLSNHLIELKTSIDKLRTHQGYSITDFVRRRLSYRQISRVVQSIEDCISSWVDREIVLHLIQTLEQSNVSESVSDHPRLEALSIFEKRLVARGFNREHQDLILRSRIFHMLETLLQNPDNPITVREQSAAAIAALVKFNRDVFVGLALMGPTETTLVSISSIRSIQILSKLIRLIQSALVDELETHQEISKILDLFLHPGNDSIRIAAFECLLEITYYARREVVELMLESGIVEKLVELQRTETGKETEKTETVLLLLPEIEKTAPLLEKERIGDWEEGVFERCVARFAVQLEVGERLGRKERRELKLEILRRVRECCQSEAEGATILAEVLWGSSP